MVFCNIFMAFKIAFIYFYVRGNNDKFYNIYKYALKIKSIRISLFNLTVLLITFMAIYRIVLLFVVL